MTALHDRIPLRHYLDNLRKVIHWCQSVHAINIQDEEKVQKCLIYNDTWVIKDPETTTSA